MHLGDGERRGAECPPAVIGQTRVSWNTLQSIAGRTAACSANTLFTALLFKSASSPNTLYSIFLLILAIFNNKLIFTQCVQMNDYE